MANISWSTSIQVAGGPTITVTQGPIVAEAIERIEVSVPAGSDKKLISLPAGPISDIHLLLIKSSHYKDITFKVSDGSNTADGDGLALTGPQFFSGGAAALFGSDQEAHFLEFINSSTSGDTAQIEIFVARDATPPAP
ncbi:hypothetical protein C8R32_1162 [Nitrosospira sp. Nsp5]|uniref:Uncharacterized protein n=1 Tax=Nitrosospira multiformis TaxID=1231 RepID=A0ABY0TCH7_9PROT|nr:MULTISPECIES: hypothetical protein [Nitrosospira]PTR05756.1 hypothetical protein C8R32_1162 [Nitrosospira sp. Nsp5]SDQ62192.1 hypothetical protein SAMN05216402_1585 [Nitrosospira multiformis]